MRFGLLSQWFDPEPGPASLPGVLARGLADRGHEVRVLTGFPNYPSGTIMPGYRLSRRMDERIGGVQIRRVALYPSHDSSPVRRLATYGSFAASAVANGVRALRGFDAVWVSNSPITVSLPMWFLRYAYRVPLVLHVLDLWPDTVEASGMVGRGRTLHLLERAMATWCHAMYRAAVRVAYISPGVGDLLVQRGVPRGKLLHIPLWADEEALIGGESTGLRTELRIPDDHVVLVYAGTLGEAQGMESLIEACAKLTDQRFTCLIAGSGVCEGSLRKRAEEVGASNVRFLGRISKERMPALMATGDAHFVSLRTAGMAPYTIPSKVQATLAAGRAMVVAAEGDVVRVAQDSGAGLCVRPGDATAIAEGLRIISRLGRQRLDELGRRGRTYYEQMFSAQVGVDRIEAALCEAASTGRRG